MLAGCDTVTVVGPASQAGPELPQTVAAAGGFDIVTAGVSALPASVERALSEATTRWRSVVRGDLPDEQVDVPAGLCNVPHEAISRRVDDLLIFVEVNRIDGPGGALASAGPCMLRRGSRLPILGIVRVDSDDVARLAAADELSGVLLHEIGHVLGLGPLWEGLGQLSGAGSANPVHTGAHAIAEYRAAGGAEGPVPLENSGSIATRDVHWREAALGAEIMTGWINHHTRNPLSRVTVGALEDLGYVVDYSAADPFSATAAGSQVLTGFTIEEVPAPPPRLSRF